MKFFIDNVRGAWRLFSVWVASAAVVFGTLPVDQQGAVLQLLNIEPERVPAVLGVLFLLARIVKQPGASAPGASATDQGAR
jgi:hypothetical protein